MFILLVGPMTIPSSLCTRAPVHVGNVQEDAPTHAFCHGVMARDRREASAVARGAFDRNVRGMCKCSGRLAGDEGGKLFSDVSAGPTLVSSVASFLQQLAAQNDSEGCGAPCFLSATEPTISVPDYVDRLARFFQCSRECFVLALIYIDRLLRGNSHIWLCPLNVHRLVVTALMVAVKFADDTFYSNAYYAKVGGLPLKEMNHLEATLLRMLHFRLHVMPWEFHRFFRLVIDSPFSHRPRVICCNINSNSSSLSAPAAADDSHGFGPECSGSTKVLEQSCGNPCCSPSWGSTGCFSGSSHSTSPPFTPEAAEVQSPSEDGDPRLQRFHSRYDPIIRSCQQQEGELHGSGKRCARQHLEQVPEHFCHSHVQLHLQQVPHRGAQRVCCQAKAHGVLPRHFNSAPHHIKLSADHLCRSRVTQPDRGGESGMSAYR